MTRPYYVPIVEFGVMVVIFALAIVGFSFIVLSPRPPRLVGLGCDGTKPGSLIYAQEEDDFPYCESIIQNDGYIPRSELEKGWG